MSASLWAAGETISDVFWVRRNFSPMTTHSMIDSRWRGIPTSFRKWISGDNYKVAFEWSSRWRYLSIGFDLNGEDDLAAHFAIPLLWLSFSAEIRWPWARALRKRFCAKFGNDERSTGIRFNDASFSWSIFDKDDHRRGDPWWHRGYIQMPWMRQHLFTEILSLDLSRVVWRDDNGRRFMDFYEQREAVKAANSQSVPYCYVRKNGERQERTGTFYVERRALGYRWLLYPFHVRTSVWINLVGEIGERVGSWKGGTTGFGTDLQKGETPLAAIIRMENTRKFDR
jgi:hypothetical protein